MDTWEMLVYFAMGQSVVGAVAAGFLLAQTLRIKRLTKEAEKWRERHDVLEKLYHTAHNRHLNLLDRMREVVE